MATTIIEIHDLPTRFDEAVALASSGSEVILTESDIPRARLLPLRVGTARVPGLHPGAIQTADDFDAPLSDEFWTGSS